MKLIDFTINRENVKPQPVLIHEANGNSFVVFAQFTFETVSQSDRLKLTGMLLSVQSIQADKQYVYVKCASYDNKGSSVGKVLLHLDVSDRPVYDKCTSIAKLTNPQEFGKGDYIEFHLSFNTVNCDNSNALATINNGDWPCNKNITI